MKSKAVNTLGYTGIVTLSQCIGNRKVTLAKTHNRGGHTLFNFLSDCLIGDFDTAKNAVPSKIMLLNVIEGRESYSYESISAFIYLRTRPEKLYDPAAGIVKYSFIIPRDIFESARFNQLGIGLYTAGAEDPHDFVAFCNIDVTASEIATTSILVLDWELKIANTSGET